MAHYIKNEEKNGIEIYFDKKPLEAVLFQLKTKKWRWYPSKKCWYHRNTYENELYAKLLCDEGELVLSEENIEIDEQESAEQEDDFCEESSEEQIFQRNVPVRVDIPNIVRNYGEEQKYGIKKIRFYAFREYEHSVSIIGEVLVEKPWVEDFCLYCSVFDESGKIIQSEYNNNYGRGEGSSNVIKEDTYFPWFPFKFEFFDIDADEIDCIVVLPCEP